MMPRLIASALRAVSALSTRAAVLILSSLGATAAFAATGMPFAEQNALVQKYCAVCHTDAVRNGGLSLQHFDAGSVAPSLAAMMVSKITSGVSLATAVVAKSMKGGAMGAAGIPIPAETTIDAFIHALASEAGGAHEWSVNRTGDPASGTSMLTASILREVSSSVNGERGSMYRLVLACNPATRQGEMQVAWALGFPKSGTLSVTADGNAPVNYSIDSRETMGNGTDVTTGPAAISLKQPTLPSQALKVRGLVYKEVVEFPFGGLGLAARESLSVCFTSEESH